MSDDRPRCSTCGKTSFRTWREAQMNAIGYMWTRKGARGFRPYYSRACGVFHVGRATSYTRRRMTRKAMA